MNRCFNAVEKLLATISLFTSAPFISLYILAILSFYNMIGFVEQILLFTILVITPIAIVLYYSRAYGVEWDFPDRRHRLTPLLLIVLFYTIGFVISVLIELSYYTKLLLLAYTLNGVSSLIITLWEKISLHVIGVVGPAIYLILVGLLYCGLLFLVISIIVSYTRIYLGRHTYKQVVKGYIALTLFTLVAYGVLNAIYRL